MDTITDIVSILILLWPIVLLVSAKRRPQPSLSTAVVKTEEQELILPEQTGGQQKEEEIPQRPVKRGNFPPFVDKLSSREICERMKVAIGNNLGAAITIYNVRFHGGETFWMSGCRTDREFIYSNDGTDLFPIIVSRN